MNVSLFYKNLQVLNDLFASTDIAAKYTQLVPAIVAYRNGPDETTKKALDAAIAEVEVSLKQVVEGISKVPHSNLLIEELKAEHLVGNFSSQTLGNVVYSDLFTAHDRIQNMATETQALQDNITKIVADLVALKYGTEKEENRYLVTFEFLAETEIKDLNELEIYAKKIKLILYNYACLSEDKAESSPIIYGISKGSPLTIDISWVHDNLPTILKLIGLSIIFYLNKKEESLKNIELEQLVIKQVPKEKLPKKLADGLKELHTSVLDEKAINEHVQELIGAIKVKSQDRTQEEQASFLRKGVEELMELLENGARVDVYKPQESASSDEESKEVNNETTIIYTKYSEIEQKTKSLTATTKLTIPKKTTQDDLTTPQNTAPQSNTPESTQPTN